MTAYPWPSLGEVAAVRTAPAMRDRFFDALFPLLEADPRCVLLSADMGAPSVDKFWKELPRQFHNVGIAEQQALGMAAGMALEGRKVFVYGIAPFVAGRAYEFLKLDVCGMSLDVTVLGVGAGLAYDTSGPTHHGVDDIALTRMLPGLKVWSPADGATAAELARWTYEKKGPHYVRFDRGGLQDLSSCSQKHLEQGFRHERFEHAQGGSPSVLFVTTGIGSHLARQAVGKLLGPKCPQVDILDVIRLSPLPAGVMDEVDRRSTLIVTVEEHWLSGGLGSMLAEQMAEWRKPLECAEKDREPHMPLLRIGIPDCFSFGSFTRQQFHEKYEMTPEHIARRVLERLG